MIFISFELNFSQYTCTLRLENIYVIIVKFNCSPNVASGNFKYFVVPPIIDNYTWAFSFKTFMKLTLGKAIWIVNTINKIGQWAFVDIVCHFLFTAQKRMKDYFINFIGHQYKVAMTSKLMMYIPLLSK